MTASMIRYGDAKLIDINVFVENPTTIKFMEFIADGMKSPLWFSYTNALFQMISAFMVLLGFHTRIAAGLLVGWLSVLKYFGHPFWMMEFQERIINESLFYRNLALIAAHVMIFATGPGQFSIDKK